MKITLVITDSYADCTRAVQNLINFGEKLSARLGILAILEDLYKLEKASVSLGVPLPPDTVPSAKKRFEDRIHSALRQVDGGKEVDLQVVAGDVREEVERYVKDNKPDLLMFGCSSAHEVCRVIDEIGVSSLIIK